MQKIQTAMDHTQSHSAFAQFNLLEEKVEREEAISEAWDRLEGNDPDAVELERKFEADERKQQVIDELVMLKSTLKVE